MKKALLIWLLILSMFLLAPSAQAGGVDEENIRELISKAEIVPGLTYGRETKRVILTEDWTIPRWDPFGEGNFRFFVMNPNVLRTPEGGRYPDFITNITGAGRGSYKKGDEILVVLLHKDISFDTFKHWIFRPWLRFARNFGSQNWFYVRIGNQWYGKPRGALSQSLITGVENFRDFICNGQGDPDFIEVDGNSVTVAKLRYMLCPHADHNDFYAGRDKRPERPEAFNIKVDGQPIADHFESEERTTFEITPIPENMPRSWIEWR